MVLNSRLTFFLRQYDLSPKLTHQKYLFYFRRRREKATSKDWLTSTGQVTLSTWFFSASSIVDAFWWVLYVYKDFHTLCPLPFYPLTFFYPTLSYLQSSSPFLPGPWIANKGIYSSAGIHSILTSSHLPSRGVDKENHLQLFSLGNFALFYSFSRPFLNINAMQPPPIFGLYSLMIQCILKLSWDFFLLLQLVIWDSLSR